MRVLKSLVLSALLLLGPLACSVFGQAGATGTILGTVTDSSGGTIKHVRIVITNVASGVTKRSSASSAGAFAIEYLSPGTYELHAMAEGYGTTTIRNITLTVTQQIAENIKLQRGTSETVIDQANTVRLDAGSSTISQMVTQQQVNDLPLNGRNFLSLLFIGGGAVETNGEMGLMREGEGNAISINGSRPESNNYTLDGLANTDTALGTPAVILSQDAIREFKVQSATYSAEYGYSANQVNIVTKGGTNKLHGSLFEFDRNDAFDAKGPFEAAVPKLRQNQFGFIANGPVYMPRVFDGRNTTFWMVDYEGWRINNGTNLFSTVPSVADLQGNFSGDNLPAYGTPGCTAALAQDLPCLPVNPATGTAFANNTIPESSFSRLAKVSIAAGILPAPNCVGCPQGNYRLTTNLANTVNQQTYRLDENLGRWGSVFFRYTLANYSNQGLSGSISIPSGVSIFLEKSASWEVSHTIPLGGFVNNFRFGRLDPVANQEGVPASLSDVTALGMTGVFQNIPGPFRLFPSVTLGLPATAWFGSQRNDATTSDIPVWDFADSIATVRGRHTISAGVDLRSWVQKRNLSSDYLGNFIYDNSTVQNNGDGCATASGLCGTGNSVADFLLGYYQQSNGFFPGPFSAPGTAGNTNQYHFLYFAPFFQDDWKVNDRLALNLGLRWDYRSVPYEQNNKMFWFDTSNPGGGLCMADQLLATQTVAALGGPIAPAGNGFYRYCGRRNPASGSKAPFAPRIGFSYRPFGNNTVLRGGYGIFFDSSETREIDDSGDVYPFVIRNTLIPSQDSTTPKLTDNMFPVVPLHTVSPAIDGGQTFAVIISERPRNPYFQQWSLSVQRELAKDSVLEVSYVGTRGTHLLARANIGQPLPPSDPAACAINPNSGDCPVSARRPFANITSPLGFLDSHWDSYSFYNALNVKFERRVSSMTILGVYTWSRSLDLKSAAAGLGATNGFAGMMNEHDPRADYGPSDFDVPNRFVGSFVYELPLGRGRRFGRAMNRMMDFAAGGWEITGISTFQAGFPFSVLCNDLNGLLVTYTQRCNLVGVPGNQHGLTNWFNTSAIQQPLPGQFGNSGRNILREPGINNWDIGIDKAFELSEKIQLQLRLETFNAFNHAEYGLDPTQAGVTPGQSAVGNVFGAPDFGKVTIARPGRIVQLGGKLTF